MQKAMNQLTKEQRIHTIDEMNTLEIVQTINEEDQMVALAIKKVLPQIAAAVDLIYEKMAKGGRLIYMGAGASGRLGIIDATECLSTYGVESVLAIIAGGVEALTKAVEGAEDSRQLAIYDLQTISLTSNDVVCGLTASGRTPYVLGGLHYAHEIGAKTISICCVNNGEISQQVDFPIEILVGPEVITGSTRMKAGTAQKIVLNMLSTSVMIKLKKVYSHLMIDVHPINNKLKERCI